MFATFHTSHLVAKFSKSADGHVTSRHCSNGACHGPLANLIGQPACSRRCRPANAHQGHAVIYSISCGLKMVQGRGYRGYNRTLLAELALKCYPRSQQWYCTMNRNHSELCVSINHVEVLIVCTSHSVFSFRQFATSSAGGAAVCCLHEYLPTVLC